MFLDERIKGRTYLEIGAKHNIPPEEVQAMVREALSKQAVKDPVEWRGILGLRIEKVTEHLWSGLENGSFKHGEAILRAVERLQELYAVNEEAKTKAQIEMSDEAVALLMQVMDRNNEMMLATVRKEIQLGKKAQEKLEHWHEWSAEAATNAVEEIVYAEVEE